MAKYRKKPVVIDAMKLSWETWEEMSAFIGVGGLAQGKPEGVWVDMRGRPISVELFDADSDSNPRAMGIGMQIPTLEGLRLAQPGDWIVKGVKGEFYPIKDDIFEQTYELVEEAA